MAQKHEFLVIIPDKAGSLEDRMKVRPDHLKSLGSAVEAGFWNFGGAMLEEVMKEGEGPKIKGSVMLASAESEAEVWEALKKDVYANGKVWDMDKVIPFKSAIRKAL